MKKLLVVHGPNLNLLGTREPKIYGTATLHDIDSGLVHEARALGIQLESFQSNSETELIQAIHRAHTEKVGFIIINAAAYTHTSIALRDALAASGIPFIEVHLSNVYAREPFRHHSYLADLALGVISGLGAGGYRFALQYAADYLES